jgi:hypothetical protein
MYLKAHCQKAFSLDEELNDWRRAPSVDELARLETNRTQSAD